MPTRTINLKMVLGKKNDGNELRKALWTTHSVINLAVAAIEKALLLCRGAEYRTLNEGGQEVLIPCTDVRRDCLHMARKAQERNGKEGIGREEDVLTALRKLYEKVVPCCLLDEQGKQLEGDAQDANAWVSPMMDPDSQGGLSVYEKIVEPLPEWVTMMKDNEMGWEEASFSWSQTVEAIKLQSMTGSPPAWVRRLRKGQPWQEAFLSDQDKKRKELKDGNAPLIRHLKDLGLLPLLTPTVRERMADPSSSVTPWDRLAVRLAVQHLLSWESWNHKTKEQHSRAALTCEEVCRQYESLGQKIQELREYEKERHRELKRVAFAADDRPFKIGRRSMRSWDQVRDEWLKSGCNYDARKEIAKRLQTRLRGKFGDPHLFLWLAAEGREHLWRDTDILTPIVKINLARKILEKRKPYALMTFADPRTHPRWTMFEASGGSNLRNYEMKALEDGLVFRTRLLQETPQGRLAEENFSIRLGLSGQLSDLGIVGIGKDTLFRFCSAHQDFEGVPGGAEILFDRDYLEHRGRCCNSFAQGAIGPVWLKLTINVKTKAPEGWVNARGSIATPPEVHHFKTSLSRRSRYETTIQPGLRVLSVDLGMRSFASCSVFELVRGKPHKGLFFPAEEGKDTNDADKMWALHQRSFKLALPGEAPSRKEKQERKSAIDEIRSIKSDIWRLKHILRLGNVERDEDRDTYLSEMQESYLEDQSDSSVLSLKILEQLSDPKVRSTQALWHTRCQEIHDRAECVVSKRLSDWRKQTGPKSASWDDWHKRRLYHGGKSIWMIEYFETVRKLIMNWNLRGRRYGQVNRQDRKQYGTVAARLLRHINNLKKDRVKSGSDMIVQAARGYIPVRGGGGWVRKHEPCRVILFEDLARYRFWIDRPKRENSQLMKWNHREILRETKMQAELYGILTETTSAGFSSRFLASNGAPGCRCRYLSEDDFENGLPKPYVAHELEWMLGSYKRGDSARDQAEFLKDKIGPGLVVPWSGGELFASIHVKSGHAHVIHADVNAAQNLQRRFWGRCGEAFRLVCRARKIDGNDVYEMERPPGSRLLGALQKMANGGGPFYLRSESESERYAMVRSGTRMAAAERGEEEDAMETELEDALSELEESSGEGRETFFRDPSGLFFDDQTWIPSRVYWSIVRNRVWANMKQ